MGGEIAERGVRNAETVQRIPRTSYPVLRTPFRVHTFYFRVPTSAFRVSPLPSYFRVPRKHRDLAETMIDALQDASRETVLARVAHAATHPVWSEGGWKGFSKRGKISPA